MRGSLLPPGEEPVRGLDPGMARSADARRVFGSPLSSRKAGCDASRLSESQSWGNCSVGSAVTREYRSRCQADERLAAIRERAIMNMKRFAAIAVLSIGASSPVLADDQKPANLQEGYLPPLNLMMVATQLNHFKLWYAGAVRNWPLASYELAQIRTSIDRAKRLYPNNVESNMTMMAPAADEVDNAIKAKDGVRFSKSFSKLTAACNSCHEATGFGFIRMRDPTLSPIETSPFSDESFSGH